MQKSANGADISDVSAFRNALQLGTAATRDVGADNASKLLGLDSFRSMMSGNVHLHSMHCDDRKPGETYVAVEWWQHKKADAGYALPLLFPMQAYCDRKPWNIWLQCRDECAYCQQNAYQYSELVAIRRGTEDCCFIALGSGKNE